MRRLKRRLTQPGFTLLEILIALAVFSILALITSQALRNAFSTKQRVMNQLEQTRELQFAFALLNHDTQQATARSVIGNEMRTFPPFVGQPTYIELTRGGVVPHLKKRQSPFIRIGYLCKNNQLVRRTFQDVDIADRTHYEDETVLDHLTTCRFAFLNAPLQLLPIWRPGAVRQNQQPEPLPKAIQLTLHHAVWGKVTYLLTIPEAMYADLQPIKK